MKILVIRFSSLGDVVLSTPVPRLLKEKFPKVYLYNPTPIHKSLWHIATNCVAVKKDYDIDRYVWKQPNHSHS